MKTTRYNTLLQIAAVVAALLVARPFLNAQGHGRGHGMMPAEARDAIHGLFDSHAKFKREVSKTETGYVSKTTSDDPAAVKLIQTHVKQMESRLAKGLMVRRWDPAYEEFVRHYDDIDIQIKKIKNGISVTAIGKTPQAREVARNHAGIVSKFVDHGWAEHDKTHAAVYPNAQPAGAVAAKACCLAEAGEAGGKACCAKETGKEAGAGKGCCGACEAGKGKGPGPGGPHGKGRGPGYGKGKGYGPGRQ